MRIMLVIISLRNIQNIYIVALGEDYSTTFYGKDQTIENAPNTFLYYVVNSLTILAYVCFEILFLL